MTFKELNVRFGWVNIEILVWYFVISEFVEEDTKNIEMKTRSCVTQTNKIERRSRLCIRDTIGLQRSCKLNDTFFLRVRWSIIVMVELNHYFPLRSASCDVLEDITTATHFTGNYRQIDAVGTKTTYYG